MRCFVYVIGSQPDCHKVGIAKNPEARMRELQTGHPGLLRLRFSVECDNARDVECEVHEALGDWRVTGEWFRVRAEEAQRAIEWVLAGSRVGELHIRSSRIRVLTLRRQLSYDHPVEPEVDDRQPVRTVSGQVEWRKPRRKALWMAVRDAP